MDAIDRSRLVTQGPMHSLLEREGDQVEPIELPGDGVLDPQGAHHNCAPVESPEAGLAVGTSRSWRPSMRTICEHRWYYRPRRASIWHRRVANRCL